MARKIDYAATYGFTLRKDGRHMKGIPLPDGKIKSIYDRDPEKLYNKWQAMTIPQPPTFERVAEAWQDKHWTEIKAGTKTYYTAALRRAITEQQGKLITDVTPSDINRHLLALADDKYARKTVSAQKSVYKLIFNFAIISNEPWLKGFIKVNPTTAVQIPKGLPVTAREAPEDDIINLIINNANKPFGLFPMIALYTGFRRSEIIALTWGDLERKNKMIKCDKAMDLKIDKLKDTKTTAGVRRVPLLDGLQAVLKRPRGAKDSDLIFTAQDGKPLTEASYSGLWLSWCIAVGLTKIIKEKRGKRNGKPYIVNSVRPALGAHQLRHAYATILFEAGVDVYSAKEYLGHKHIETTMAIYTHLRQKQRGKSAELLNDHFNATYCQSIVNTTPNG